MSLGIEQLVDMATNHSPVLTITGELDVYATRGLSEPLNTLIGSAARAVIVDLSAVTFMDSTGLGMLIKARRRLDAQGRSLIVICPAGPVRQLLEVTNLLTMFCVVDDEASAHQAAAARLGGEATSGSPCDHRAMTSTPPSSVSATGDHPASGSARSGNS